MIEIRNVLTVDGDRRDLYLEGNARVIDGSALLLLPALIDPHVHFRTPGGEYKESWESGAQAAIAGGITTVLDMPNTSPPTITAQLLNEKERLIASKLKIPLHFGLYLGADRDHLDEILKAKQAVGLKIYMGHSTGGLVMSDRPSLDRAFALARDANLVVAVHAEDESCLHPPQGSDPAHHSKARPPEAARRAVETALELALKYGTPLYICHVSTMGEVALIRQAKRAGQLVFAEVTPHHLFLDESAYAQWGTKALVNPPLRSHEDREALWEGIHDETIDTIGSDHAPHTLAEKNLPYGQAPSGFPNLELTLPLLLNAHKQGNISLEQIVTLTHIRPQEIFNLPMNEDCVLVDLHLTKTVDQLKTKAGWSPFQGWSLTGWPRYTILEGNVYDAVVS